MPSEGCDPVGGGTQVYKCWGGCGNKAKFLNPKKSV